MNNRVVQTVDSDRVMATATYLSSLVGSWGRVLVDGNNGALTVVVSSRYVVTLRRLLRDHSVFQCKVLSGLTAADYPQEAQRFQVTYRLLSLRWNRRLTVQTYTDDVTAVPSIVSVHPSANWYEREVFDRFGVLFAGHPDRRRLLTDYGFEGHPLRKDFPLTGYREVRYDEAAKRVVQEPVSLSQERRRYDFRRPWAEGGERPLVAVKGS